MKISNKNKKNINLAIIGFGFMGKTYAHAAQSLKTYFPDCPNLKLKTVVLKNLQNERIIKERYQISEVTDDYLSVFSDPEINAVYISTPTDNHFKYVKLAIENNKHFLCEKPITSSLQETETLNQLLKENKSIISNIVFEYRFVPAVNEIKKLINNNILGEIIQFRVCYLHGSYIVERPETWRLKKNAGGVILDLAPHVLDLVNYLIAPINEIKSKSITCFPGRKVEDISWMMCKTVNDINGTIEVSRMSTGSIDDLRIEIHGYKGAVKWSLENLNYLEYFSKDNKYEGFLKIPIFNEKDSISDFPPPKVTTGWMRSHIDCLYNFIKKVENTSFFDIKSASFEDGLLVQSLIHKIKSENN